MKEIKNYEYCQKVVDLKKNIEVAFLTLGEMLFKIRQMRMYEPQWESFAEYLEEIKMSESVASRLITVYQKMILEYGFDPKLIANAGGWSNVYEIVKLSPTKEDAESWLNKGETLMASDMKIALREAKSGVSQDKCEHDYYTIKVCRKCGHKERIYDTDDTNEFNKK